MAKNKYVELREKRFREREERFRRERERIKEQNLPIRQRRWVEVARRKARFKTRFSEDEKPFKEMTRDRIRTARMIAEEIEKQIKASFYVPEIAKRIDEMLTEANRSFDLGEYEKASALSHEVEELAKKARLETSVKVVGEKRRKEEGKYFYCIIPYRAEISFGNMGIDNNEVYAIPCKDIAAVVSDSPMKDYELTESNTKRHEEVVRQVMEEHTVIPVEFGTVIKNERILKHLLKKAYDPVGECLRFVDNMVELGVKAVLNGDGISVKTEERKELVSDVLGSLSNKAKQFVTGDIFSNRLVLNSSFLVNKKDVDAFSNGVTGLQEKYPMVKLLYSGPWAPYNFVYIKIGLEGMEIGKRGEADALFN